MPKARPVTDTELRAAKLTRIPGVTLAEAAKRFQVPVARVRAARRDCPEQTQVSLAELALAALTNNGLERSFTLQNLERVAGYLDYVNHDGSTAEDVRRLLAELAEQGWIALGDDSGELVKAWP
ncbi:MAG TPA: hypothetical protein VNG33_15020 [Polyangiaceae bacterium]|nr:hypothetical protein [Polyangiaceae bacterium]